LFSFYFLVGRNYPKPPSNEGNEQLEAYAEDRLIIEHS
jgi:hypothetical protein